METALHLLGAFFLIDLFGCLLMLAFVWIIGRRAQSETRISCLLGALIYLGFCLGLIYAGLSLLLKAQY